MFGKRVQLAQHKGVGEAEFTGEGAAVVRGAEMGGNEKPGLYRRQVRRLRLKTCNAGQEMFHIRRAAAHAASRLRKVTMTDLEVGVSLSSPALPSGTRTFSSG